MNDCIFCKIITGEMTPAKKVYEDDKIIVFHDIKPVAPVHVLCVPKIHIESLNDVNESNIGYVSYILEKIPKVAKTLGIYDGGYRVVMNVGKNGGQTVNHLHIHVIGGKKLIVEFL